MATLWQDIVFGLRILRKNPGFACVVVIALALGIGANATVFTLANGFLFRNLPFTDSQRVLYIASVDQASGEKGGESLPDFRDFSAQAKSLQALGALARFDVDVSDQAGMPAQYKGARCTVNAFSVVGQHPILGREFLPEDARPGSQSVAILAYSLWRSRYRGERSVIGSVIRVNEVPTVVIGVMPPGFRFPVDSSLWIPLRSSAFWAQRGNRGLTVFGRLADHSTLASARAEMDVLAQRLAAQYPDTNKGIGVQLQNFNDYFVGRSTRLILWALLGAVAFVLLIAIANVVNMLLARAVLRTREVSIRVALGAGRWRVIRQMLVESLLLAFAGGVLGSLAGIWGVHAFQSVIIPDERAAFLTFPMDYRVLTFLAVITMAAGVLSGLVPALRLSKLDINSSLKESVRGAGTSRRDRRLSSALIVFEMALAFVLLVGAGLMIRSFLNMAATPIGAQTDHVMSMDILLRPSRYPSQASLLSFFHRLNARLKSLPGVVAEGMASNYPGDGWTDFAVRLQGAAPADPHRQPHTGGVIVSSGYFAVLNVRPLRGRVFSDRDGVSGPPVVVVNRSFAQVFWRGQEPIGQRLRLQEQDDSAAPPGTPSWLTVVGVVPDIVQSDTSRGMHDPLIYIPYQELPQREMVLAARTGVPPELLANDFRRAAQALDPDLPVTDLRTLDQLLWERTWTWRIYGSMFSIFAAVALLLASVGLYSVIAHSMNQRIQEIGVRMAIGATRVNVLGMILGDGLRQVLFGLGLGLVAAFAVTRTLKALLVDVRPSDPATLIAVTLVLAMAGLLGSAIPALRAARVDPSVALRHE